MTSRLNTYCDVTQCMNGLWMLITKLESPKGDSQTWSLPPRNNGTCVIKTKPALLMHRTEITKMTTIHRCMYTKCYKAYPFFLCYFVIYLRPLHYNDIIMGAKASQITSFTIVYSTVYSSANQRRHQSSESLAFVRGIHRWPVNARHKWPVTWKMFPFDDVIMCYAFLTLICSLIYWNKTSMGNFRLIQPSSNYLNVFFLSKFVRGTIGIPVLSH